MRSRKWMMIVVSGGLLLQTGSCVTDLTTYAVDLFVQSLPELLDAWLGTGTETV